LGNEEKKNNDSGKVDDVSQVYDPPADTAVMEIDPQHFKVIICPCLKYLQFAESIKAIVQQVAYKCACYESHHRIIGKAAGANAYGSKYSPEENQSHIAACCSANIDTAGYAQLLNRISIDNGGRQCANNDEQGAEEFTPNDLGGFEGKCAQQFKTALFVFIGQAAHGNGGYQEQQHPGCQAEIVVQRSITKVKDIAIGKNEQQQSVDQQEYSQCNIPRKTAEKLLPFFFADHPHGSKLRQMGDFWLEYPL